MSELTKESIVDSVVEAIENGSLDAQLDLIFNAVRTRRDIAKMVNNTKLFYDLKYGDKVKFNSKTNPKYMVGVEGRIVEKKYKNVVVEPFPGQYLGRFADSKTIKTSVGLLDLVEKA